MAKIEDHKYSIDDAFRECFYIVPDYQREYVWTDKEVLQLLDDINEQIDAGSIREYFIGTVLVSPASEKNHYEVIDGQQRLTTFFLILCALRELFQGEPQEQTLSGLITTSYTDKEGNTRASLKLEPRYENASEVMSKLVSVNGDPQAVRGAIQTSGITPFGSLENLMNAYATVHRYLKDNYEDMPKLRKYWGYLANSVVFIQISTDVSSALKIFETINERGVGLNPMDLLKNLLFTHVKLNEFTQLKNEWKKITRPLEEDKEKPLRFLRYFLMANYVIRNDRGDAVVREDEIYDWLVDKGNAALCDYGTKPFDFVRKITINVERYLAYTHACGNDGKPNLGMDSLKRMCGGAFSLHHVLLLAASNFPKELFDHFVGQLESFLFFYIYTKTTTRDLERSFSIWADELREISKNADRASQRIQLNTFVADRFQSNMTAKEAELADSLKRYTLFAMQQYRTRYLLAKLTQFVDMAYKGLKLNGSLGEYTALEIEHILPNSPTHALSAAFTDAHPTSRYEDYKNRLGNLTLLEKPLNIVASNDFFEGKKTEYLKSKYYLTSSIAGIVAVGQNTSISRINEKLQEFADWTPASIERRQELLIALARDVWKTFPIPAQ